MIRTGIFLQVRLRSSRLPRKALLKLCGKTVTEHAMEGLRKVKADVYAILTDDESGPELEPLARRCGFDVFCGDPDDVLSRYAAAVRHYRIDRYMRATGDNPLVSWELAESIIPIHEKAGADFSGYLGPPLGTCVELTESEAILAADKEATEPYEREHVSPFIYHRPERFTVSRPWAPDHLCLPESTVTLDTEEDYEKIQKIYAALYEDEPVPVDALVRWLKDTLRGDTDERSPKHTSYSFGKTG